MKDIRKPDFLSDMGGNVRGNHPALTVLIALALLIIGSLVGGVIQFPAMLVYLFNNKDYMSMILSGHIDPNILMKVMFELPDWIVVITLLSEAGLIAVTLLYCRFLEKRKCSTLGFRRKGCVLQYVKGIFMGALIFLAAWLICLVTGSLEFKWSSISVKVIAYVTAFFFGYLVQGMAEEVLCRGFLLTSLTKRCSVTASVLISAVFFTLLHGMNSGMNFVACLNLFLFGVLMAVLFLHYENIWLVGAFHSVWNFVQGNIFGIQVSGLNYQPTLGKSSLVESHFWLSGGKFGLEGGLAVTLVLLVMIAVYLLLMKKAGDFVDYVPVSPVQPNQPWQQPNRGMPPQQSWQPPIQDTEEQLKNPAQESDASLGNQSGDADKETKETKQTYENMGLNPEESPWHPENTQENHIGQTGFDQSYFRDEK